MLSDQEWPCPVPLDPFPHLRERQAGVTKSKSEQFRRKKFMPANVRGTIEERCDAGRNFFLATGSHDAGIGRHGPKESPVCPVLPLPRRLSSLQNEAGQARSKTSLTYSRMHVRGRRA